jgi:hypothetical protein
MSNSDILQALGRLSERMSNRMSFTRKTFDNSSEATSALLKWALILTADCATESAEYSIEGLAEWKAKSFESEWEEEASEAIINRSKMVNCITSAAASTTKDGRLRGWETDESRAVSAVKNAVDATSEVRHVDFDENLHQAAYDLNESLQTFVNKNKKRPAPPASADTAVQGCEKSVK